jgi:hypothetical protein
MHVKDHYHSTNELNKKLHYNLYEVVSSKDVLNEICKVYGILAMKCKIYNKVWTTNLQTPRQHCFYKGVLHKFCNGNILKDPFKAWNFFTLV